ncbi:MAG: Smr/MutS family protein [Pseudomonadota bacterium]
MATKPPVSSEDADLFRQAVGNVKRLKDDRTSNKSRPPRAVPRQQQLDDAAVLGELLSDPSESELLETGEHLSYRKNGVQQAVLRKLRRGNFSIQSELDLHGMTVEDARNQVRGFLTHALHQEQRCVRIIHGKGRRQAESAPRLKGFLNHWLQRKKEVVAFCSARPEDGGTGAVYVLLSGHRGS